MSYANSIKQFLVESGMAIHPETTELTPQDMVVWTGFLQHSEGLDPHRAPETVNHLDLLSESLQARLRGEPTLESEPPSSGEELKGEQIEPNVENVPVVTEPVAEQEPKSEVAEVEVINRCTSNFVL